MRYSTCLSCFSIHVQYVSLALKTSDGFIRNISDEKVKVRPIKNETKTELTSSNPNSRDHLAQDNKFERKLDDRAAKKRC